MLPTKGQSVRKAMCMAEKASRACITYGVVAPIRRRLEAVLAFKFTQMKSSFDVRRNVTSPESEVVRIDGSQLVVQSRNVVDQTKILDRVQMRHGRRVYSKAGEREDACSLPFSNSSFDLRCPHQVGLVGSGGAFRIGNLHIIIGASNLVLSTVAAACMLALEKNDYCEVGSPLREVFVTTNVSALAVEQSQYSDRRAS
jgi:hypothetical protein